MDQFLSWLNLNTNRKEYYVGAAKNKGEGLPSMHSFVITPPLA